MEKINELVVSHQSSIKKSLKTLDKGGIGCIFVQDRDQNIIGIVTDGDFRRAVLNGINLDEKIDSIANKQYKYLTENHTVEDIETIFRSTVIEHIPILKEGKLVDLIIKTDYFSRNNRTINYGQLDTPVVIMAGGRGTRLAPFTNILPKPLIPVGNSSIIEIIMDEYSKYGINEFHLSINYKGKMIKAYFEDFEKEYIIHYIEENKPLGTGGALKYLEKKITKSFFVSNCDIIIRGDYNKIYDFHKENNNELTIVGSLQHVTIPYGVCTIEKGGNLQELIEKPEYDFLVNTGMYVLEPSVLQYIPENTLFNLTDLINKLLSIKAKVGVYPISAKSYLDIGQWKDYQDSIKTLNL